MIVQIKNSYKSVVHEGMFLLTVSVNIVYCFHLQ